MSDNDKDLEVLIVRYQLGIADRKHSRTVRPDLIEKLTLAVLVTKLKQKTNRSTNQLGSTL
jgi:hypothetical protein